LLLGEIDDSHHKYMKIFNSTQVTHSSQKVIVPNSKPGYTQTAFAELFVIHLFSITSLLEFLNIIKRYVIPKNIVFALLFIYL
jgi:hypothetical protein